MIGVRLALASVILIAMPAVCGHALEGQPAVPIGKPQSDHERTSVTQPLAPIGFDEWKQEFRARALSQGVLAHIFETAFAGIVPDAYVLEQDRAQPEFTRQIWEYLDVAVSPARVAKGRRRAAHHAELLQNIEARYNVDRNAVLAIWGLETAYGANMGTIPVIRSLATLAHDGRRREFAEEQLIAALRVVQAGDVAPGQMIGSWAGAMGHTQFIPTSYADYAVDYTGDGRRDVWASNPADALASTANYLRRFGWRVGVPAVMEVNLAESFNYALAGQSVRMPVGVWRTLGVKIPGTDSAGIDEEEASVLLPAGAAGPAFLALPNFRVILRYNNATSYALAVARLADMIGSSETRNGGGEFSVPWPRNDRALGRDEKAELQRQLTALGFDAGGVDGIIGPNSRAAVRAFQQVNGFVPDGYVSGALLDRVRAASP